MPLNQAPDGSHVPDKDTPWPSLAENERDKVYESLKEVKAGNLATLNTQYNYTRNDIETKTIGNLKQTLGELFDNVNSGTFNFGLEMSASDPSLQGMPVSMTLLQALKKGIASGPPGNRDEIMPIIEGPENLMRYSLYYLQHAPENKALRASSKYNIDTVPNDGFVKITQSTESNDDGRWKLQILDKDGKELMMGYIFPPMNPPTVST